MCKRCDGNCDKCKKRETRRAMLVSQYIQLTGQAPPPIDQRKRDRLEQLGKEE